jgi:hypothetical protein
MKPIPPLKNDFILNDQEYQLCNTWLNEANEQTIRHPLEDAELETDRRRMKAMVEEYETNWRGQVQR